MFNDYTGLCAITFEYQKVLRQLFVRNETSPVDPTELLSAFREIYPRFVEKKQHDANEVFMLLADVFERSIGTKVFTGVEDGQEFTSLILDVNEPCGLLDLLEDRAVTTWPQVICFTLSMYTHKFPVTFPFKFMDRNLFAVVMHRGEDEAGHYALCVKVHDTWYIKEDEHVHEIPYDIETMRGDFYMALYRPYRLLA
jgi:hypothetical protein